jgi:uncharacterized RDD family membrane protein YckC
LRLGVDRRLFRRRSPRRPHGAALMAGLYDLALLFLVVWLVWALIELVDAWVQS